MAALIMARSSRHERGRRALSFFSRAGRIRPHASPGRSNNFERVETVGFDYGQRHRVELECRNAILREDGGTSSAMGGVGLGDDHMLDLSVLGQVSDTALTSDAEIAFREDGLPNTFVPGRNLLFFTLAAAVAYRRRLRHLVGGMCETDYSGYPDCRDDTIKALQVALNLGMNDRLVLHTPLMWIDKADDLGTRRDAWRAGTA